MIQNEAAKVHITLVPTKDTTDYTLMFEQNGKRKLAASKYRPRQEIQAMVKGQLTNKEMIIILFGLTCGYVLEEILSLTQGKGTVIVLDRKSVV